jgi:hypothetical protein
MRTDRETARIVRSWLEEGVTALPDRVLDAVLDQVPATRQRRSWWPAWRFADMNAYAKLAIGVAAVAVVAVVGITLLPAGRTGVGSGPTISPSPPASPPQSPTAAPSPPRHTFDDRMPPAGPLVPGQRYTVVAGDPEFAPQGDITLTFAMPEAGWTSDGSLWLKGHMASPEETLLSFNTGSGIPAVFTDACAHSGPRQFENSIAGQAEAWASEPGADLVSEPSDVTVDGRAATYVAISIPEDVGCSNTEYRMAYDPRCSFPGCWYPTWLGSTMRFWTVDVGNGMRLGILAESRYSDARPDLEQEIQQIVDSIQFE